MSPKLKPLLLPLLVEERRKRESMSDSDMDLWSASCYAPTSSTSEIHSPTTPTSWTRGHFRYPSSSSSIESSPCSPTFCGNKTKRSLPDVQEEPHERDDDFDMFDDASDLYDQCLCKCGPIVGRATTHHGGITANPSFQAMTRNACIASRPWPRALCSFPPDPSWTTTSPMASSAMGNYRPVHGTRSAEEASPRWVAWRRDLGRGSLPSRAIGNW